MKTVSLRYPGAVEDLRADYIGDGIVELRDHAGFVPLAPGDRVFIDADEYITGVEHLEPLFTYEVALHLPSNLIPGAVLPPTHKALVKIAKLEEEWRRDAWVTRTTNFTFLISSQSRRWLEEKVASHPYVEHVDMRRTPDLKVEFQTAVSNWDVNGDGGGPWS